MNKIKISGIEQFLHENLTWERALDFYLQENAYLKTRLSKVVDNNTDKDFLALAERFQNNFIQNDESVKDMQSDILTLRAILNNVLDGKTEDENKILKKQNKLSNEMGFFERNFATLKSSFNNYLNSSLFH